MKTKKNTKLTNRIGNYIDSHWWTWYAIATVWATALLAAAR